MQIEEGSKKTSDSSVKYAAAAAIRHYYATASHESVARARNLSHSPQQDQTTCGRSALFTDSTCVSRKPHTAYCATRRCHEPAACKCHSHVQRKIAGSGAHADSNRSSRGQQPGLTRGATGAHTGNNRSSHGEATGQAVKVGPRTSLRKGEAVSRPWTYTAIGALHGAIQSTPEHYPEMARSKAWRCSLFLSKELELLLVY